LIIEHFTVSVCNQLFLLFRMCSSRGSYRFQSICIPKLLLVSVLPWTHTQAKGKFLVCSNASLTSFKQPLDNTHFPKYSSVKKVD